MEHYLESMVVMGKMSQLPRSSAIMDQQCELIKDRRITGILLCGHGHFMAVIEGQPLVLQALIKQTIKDRESLQIIHQAKIPERGYRRWNMHITQDVKSSPQDDSTISNLINKRHQLNNKQSNYQIIKEIVAYYYCEYIVNGICCDDYRIANIA